MENVLIIVDTGNRRTLKVYNSSISPYESLTLLHSFGIEHGSVFKREDNIWSYIEITEQGPKWTELEEESKFLAELEHVEAVEINLDKSNVHTVH